MKARWEYMVSTSRDELQQLGLEGWELVSVTIPDGVETFYFKRPCPGVREQITLSQRDNALRDKGGDSA